jgi:orotidine-5'-phosphate decarboxylase
MKLELKDRLAFALDVPALEARGQIDLMAGIVGWIKINSVFVDGGHNILMAINKPPCSKIFLDLKWHDIPNTVENYVKGALNWRGIGMFNVHASGGLKMMQDAVNRAREISDKDGIERPLIIAVTFLTSIDQSALNDELGIPGTVADHVKRLAALAQKAGCDGVVASPQEAEMIRSEFGKDFIIVTPAIRFEEEAKDDQQRLATPRKAIASGSDILVMGRSLIKGGLEAVKRAYAEIETGLKDRGN